MKLWVGLGNPGAKYAGNRHNIGFMAVDRIAADHGFTPWRKSFQGLVAEGRLGTEKVALLKPETFMNLSGQSVQAAVAFWKLPLADLTVFHDELDLAPGKLRLKQGGGHAGHNGLRSIHGHLGDDYARVRLGIGHPGHKDAVAAYVLHDFAKADAEWLEDLLRGISDGAEALATGGRGSDAPDPVAESRRFLAARRNSFPTLDDAAERLAQAVSNHDNIVGYLKARHNLRVRRLPSSVMVGSIRRLDRHRKEILLDDGLDTASQLFQLALQLAYLEMRDDIDAVANEGAFVTESGERLTRRALAPQQLFKQIAGVHDVILKH